MSWDDSDDNWGKETGSNEDWGNEDPWAEGATAETHVIPESTSTTKAEDPWGAEDEDDPWAYPEEDTASEPPKEAEPVAEPELSEPERLAQGKDLLGPESNSPDVKLMQKALLAIGFKLQLTGVFDKASLSALQTFQMQRKLPINGRLDARSRAELARLWTQRLSQAPQVAKAPAQRPTAIRITHPEELPRYDTLKAKQLTLDLGPESPTKPCSEGPEVQLLQKVLILSGCELSFNGRYDKATYNAVRKLQPKYQLPITGLIDARTREQFNQVIQESQAFEQRIRRMWYVIYPYRKSHLMPFEDEWEQIIQAWLKDLLDEVIQLGSSGDQAIPESELVERPLLSQNLGTPGQQVISKGIEVERLQEVLNSLGYKVKVNQQFDLQTFDALKQFQAASGLPPSGIGDLPTREVLNQYLQTRYERERAWEGLFEVIREMQREKDLKTSSKLETRIQSVLDQLLNQAVLPIRCPLGILSRPGMKNFGVDVLLLRYFLQLEGFEIEPTMSFDQATSNTLKQFQKEHKLPMSGTLDPKTLSYINEYWSEKGIAVPDEDELIY